MCCVNLVIAPEVWGPVITACCYICVYMLAYVKKQNACSLKFFCVFFTPDGCKMLPCLLPIPVCMFFKKNKIKIQYNTNKFELVKYQKVDIHNISCTCSICLFTFILKANCYQDNDWQWWPWYGATLK